MPLQPTNLPTNITEGELGHIGDSETVHSVINELTSVAGADRVGTADGSTVEAKLVAKDAALASGLPYPRRAGLWFAPAGTPATGTAAVGLATFTPFPVAKPVALDRIACEVTTAGAAGALIRLGIYAADGDGYPGTRVLDAGTVDASTTGVKEITIAQALTPGLYWLVGVPQVAACTYRTSTGGAPLASTSSTAVLGFAIAGLSRASITGPLPSPFNTGAGGTASAMRVTVRYA